MTDQDLVNELFMLQGDHELEDELLHSGIGRVVSYQQSGAHVSDVYEVILDTARACFFKPINGLRSDVARNALKNYGHQLVSPTLSECAAWQLAKRIGPPFDEMVAPTVVRTVTLPDGTSDVGALAVYLPGRERTRGFILAAPDQALSAAFFDCLIGQQDRNEGNALWYEAERRIHLIDHAFSFARPGDAHGELLFWSWRSSSHQQALSTSETEILRAIGPALDEIGRFLAPDRGQALRDRATWMENHGRIPPLGEY